MRTAALVATAALLVSACSGGATKSEASSPSSTALAGGSALDSYYQQRIQWADCSDGFQCGAIRVPLDYAHPGGTDIRLQVIRLRAQSSSGRIGSLVTNPGGPGGSGISFVRESARSF